MAYGRNSVRTWDTRELLAAQALHTRAPSPQPSRIRVIARDWVPSDTIILRGPSTTTVMNAEGIRSFSNADLRRTARERASANAIWKRPKA